MEGEEQNKEPEVTLNKPQNENYFDDEGFALLISKDHLSVTLNIFPPRIKENILSYSKIKNALIELGIKSEIEEDAIRNSVQDFVNTGKTASDVVISKGTDAQKGKDGWFELTCSKKDNIDNKTILEEKFEEIISLKKDDLIGIIHKSQNGKDGIDVFGKVIPAEHGKEKDVGIGENTYSKEKIVISIYAEIDGFLNIKSKTISVIETYTVYGDIDVRTGNIKGYGSLKVIGNVLNGFYLSLKNNVDIGGYVGDSEIAAGNNIKISGGFLGAGYGKIKAGGNVEVKFIQDQQLFSRGNLNFIREIVHSRLYVKDNIIGKGNHASIIGGYTLAGKNVEIYSAGNEYGISTIIEVGYDYELKDILINNRKNINERNKEIKKIDKEIVEYSRMKRLNETMYNRLKQLADKHKLLEEEVNKLKHENNELIKAVRAPSGAYVKIDNNIFPGTRIIINRKNYIVKEKLFGKTFKLSEENEIIMV